MAQHDYDLANAVGAAFRADLNQALLAAVTNNAGPTEPTPAFAYMFWPDTTTGFLKQRSGDNTAWVTIGTLGKPFFGITGKALAYAVALG